MAFAVSAAHADAITHASHLSVEHIYYHAITAYGGPMPPKGVPLDIALTALKNSGQCEEVGWPYLPTDPVQMSQWNPPSTATPVYKHPSTACSLTVGDIVAKLDVDKPVTVAMAISNNFIYHTGGVLDYDPIDVDVANHAMVAVGHGMQGNQNLVLIRNSWGTGWGDNGHAWVTESYLAPRLLGASTIRH